MNYPKISIVTPSYNQGSYLERTIKSVLEQRYPNLEYIIIDGGSTDDSLDIIREYQNELHFWISEPDNGMYDAIQKGFEKSSGEIMTWINSDDILAPGVLNVVGRIFSKFNDVHWLTGNLSWVDEQDVNIYSEKARVWSRYLFYNRDFKFIQQEGTFWTRNLWELAGSKVDTSMKLAGDFELWSRFIHHHHPFTIGMTLAHFRIRSQNQKSKELRNEYEKEVENIIGRYTIPLADRKKERRIRDIRRLFTLFPWLFSFRKFKLYYRNMFEFNPRLSYDKQLMDFVKSNVLNGKDFLFEKESLSNLY